MSVSLVRWIDKGEVRPASVPSEPECASGGPQQAIILRLARVYVMLGLLGKLEQRRT